MQKEMMIKDEVEMNGIGEEIIEAERVHEKIEGAPEEALGKVQEEAREKARGEVETGGEIIAIRIETKEEITEEVEDLEGIAERRRAVPGQKVIIWQIIEGENR